MDKIKALKIAHKHMRKGMVNSLIKNDTQAFNYYTGMCKKFRKRIKELEEGEIKC